MKVELNTSLNGFSIFENYTEEDKNILLKKIDKNEEINRCAGAMMGGAVGDTVGAFLEFLNASSFTSPFNIDTLKFKYVNNCFKLKHGQWTDDTSMGLCMADSLLLKKEFDGTDMRIRFWNWWNNGYNNAFRFDPSRSDSVGLGGNISKSLNFELGTTPPPFVESENEDSGNGSLMRLAPIPIFYRKNLDQVVKFSSLSSKTTHPGEIASEACQLAGFIIAKALTTNERDIKVFIDETVKEYSEKYKMKDEIRKLIESNEEKDSKELCWNWREKRLPIEECMSNRGKKYNGYMNTLGYFGSYSMDGLAVALNSVYHTDSFDKAIEKCVNYQGDADSTGSICGQIAGAFYGFNSINEVIVDCVNQWDANEIQLRGVLLAEGYIDSKVIDVSYLVPTIPKTTIS